jgi:hypothetical protein
LILFLVFDSIHLFMQFTTEDEDKGGGGGNESDDSDACSMIGAESQFVVDMCGDDAGAFTRENNTNHDAVADTVSSLATQAATTTTATTEAAAAAAASDEDAVSRAVNATVKLEEKGRLW